MIGSCPDWDLYGNAFFAILLSAIVIVIMISVISMLWQGMIILAKQDKALKALHERYMKEPI